MKGTFAGSRTVLAFLLIAASTITDAAIMQAQTVNWYEWSSASAPPDREDMSMAYDQARRSTLLFGGCCNPETWGDTWIFNDGWHQVFPSSSPSPRMGAA
jgi:hypothetical protein